MAAARGPTADQPMGDLGMGKMRNFDDRYFAEYQCGIIPQNTGCINSALDNHALKQEAEWFVCLYVFKKGEL